MGHPVAELVARARDALEKDGLLLVQDARFPSLTTLAAGAPIERSWWGHAQGRNIYGALEMLLRDAEVVDAALVSGKRTLVTRDLLAPLLAIATENAPWQTDGLDDAAQRLLAVVRRRGTVRLDEIPAFAAGRDAPGDVARLLEARLLAHGGQVHTESGAHVKTLEHWDLWAQGAGASPPWPDPADARARFAAIADRWEREYGARPRFPWDPRAEAAPKARTKRVAKAEKKAAPKRAAPRAAKKPKAKAARASKAGRATAGVPPRAVRSLAKKAAKGRVGRKAGTPPARRPRAGARDETRRSRRPSAKRRPAAG